MNDDDRLKLKEMIKANNTEDFTEKIRTLKHSSKIRSDVETYLNLCKKYPKSKGEAFFKRMCDSKCQFLGSNYTEIYVKLIKNELNLNILDSLLNVLKEIEDGNVDQHEGSFNVGKILKELYIDSALRKGDKLDKIASVKEKKKPNKQVKKISYAEFKAAQQKEQN